MASNIRVIHSRDFVTVNPDGSVDLKRSQDILRDVALAAGGLRDFSILLDLRETQSVLSIVDLWTIGNNLAEFGETYWHKTALLVPPGAIDRARFFATVAQNRGFRVNAFSGFEEAFTWLLT